MLPLLSCGGASEPGKINKELETKPDLPEDKMEFNINGKWNIRGDRLDFDVQIIQSGNRLQWWSLSRYGNGDTKVDVESFSIRGNSVKIILKQDLGIGPSTYTYNLQFINASLMRGTLKSYTEEWAGLPPISSITEVVVRRL